MPARLLATSFALSVVIHTGCSKHTDRVVSVTTTANSFAVVGTYPADGGRIFLNEALVIRCNEPVDPSSLQLDSAIEFEIRKHDGSLAEGERVHGELRLREGDATAIELLPHLPRLADFSDGGLRPGRIYTVTMRAADATAGIGLVSASGQPLAIDTQFEFRTVSGNKPRDVFKNRFPGGPVVTDFAVSPIDTQTGEVSVGGLGDPPIEVRLDFTEALSASAENLSNDLDPLTRSAADPRRVFLEYDDVQTGKTWIPSELDLERNDPDGATLVLRPLGVLPNNAAIRVIVEADLEDLIGDSNVGDPNYRRVVAQFRTASSYEVRFDALVEDFLDSSHIDYSAAFVEPLAEAIPGAIRARFDFEGDQTTLDYEPTLHHVVLNTDFTQITPRVGLPINVTGGVFKFRNVSIRNGVTIQVTGTKPMVWLVSGDFHLGGKILLEGGTGQSVTSIYSANLPVAGGVANAGGGKGGRGSPSSIATSNQGEAGFGPDLKPNGGGKGGRLACSTACSVGSGGGGGSFATAGDPYYREKVSGGKSATHWVQPDGRGGYGCTSRTTTTLPGGASGPLAFPDKSRDNDFWGAAVDLHRNLRITGELARPRGGAGGGGGGDYSYNFNCAGNDPNFSLDDKGGGGGAGGGVLIIKALGKVTIDATGFISTAGGSGGGGAWAGSNGRAGGGGGGAGGMVVIMAGESIEIATHGATYDDKDYAFAIRADGGVGQKKTWNGAGIAGKYSPGPDITSAGFLDNSPTGGFGGNGVIQLMAPPGPQTGDDQTDTILDDSIHITRKGVRLTGKEKMKFLGWMGSPDANGVYRDDQGNVVTRKNGCGDLRPSPLLLPCPYGPRSRVRSKWIDMGAVVRRHVAGNGDGLPRGVHGLPGGSPIPHFAGVHTHGSEAGFVRTVDRFEDALIDYPRITGSISVVSVDAGDSVRYRDHAAYRLELPGNNTLFAQTDRYANYTARVKYGQSAFAECRILGHTERTIFLARDDRIPSLAVGNGKSVNFEIYAKFFIVKVGQHEGFPDSFLGRPGEANQRVPSQNVRIGFAFHQNPGDPKAERFPLDPKEFFTAWNDPQAIDQLRSREFRFVKYDVLFDEQYEVSSQNPNPRSYDPLNRPRLELHRLILPFRY